MGVSEIRGALFGGPFKGTRREGPVLWCGYGA